MERNLAAFSASKVFSLSSRPNLTINIISDLHCSDEFNDRFTSYMNGYRLTYLDKYCDH